MSMITLPKDPEAEKRSLMSQRVPRCNGHQDGFQCEFYFFRRANIQVGNADNFKVGERFRTCLRVIPTQNLEHVDLATECTQYKPSTAKYDPRQEAYDPLTEIEIAALEVLYAEHKASGSREHPFQPGLALAAYKELAASSPDDPTVAAVKAKAAAAGDDLEARKREGAEARKRNAAEAAQRENDRIFAARKWEEERPAREAAEAAKEENK